MGGISVLLMIPLFIVYMLTVEPVETIGVLIGTIGDIIRFFL